MSTLQYARVAPGAVAEAGRDLREKLADQVAPGRPHLVGRPHTRHVGASFAERYGAVCPDLQTFSFGQRGLDAAVLDELAHHGAEHRESSGKGEAGVAGG